MKDFKPGILDTQIDMRLLSILTAGDKISFWPRSDSISSYSSYHVPETKTLFVCFSRSNCGSVKVSSCSSKVSASEIHPGRKK
jgi:hypothetical protein